MKNFSQILFFFDHREKLAAVGLFLLMFLGAILEATGIALIFPLIALVNDPSVIEKYAFLRALYNFFQPASINNFLVILVGLLLAFYLFKYVYLSILYYIQYRFVFNLQVSLSTRLLRAYLSSRYPFHLQRNSAELLRNVNSDVLWIFSGVMVPMFSAIIELLVVGVILLVLLITAPIPTLITIVVLGSASAAFYYFIRHRTVELGRVQQNYNAKMIQWVNQGLGGVKEIKVLEREEFFINKYTAASVGYGRAMRYLRTLNEVPRLIIEALVMGSVLFVVGTVLLLKQNVQDLIPLLGLFAMAAIRLMPSMNRILNALTQTRYYTASVEKVYQDLKLLEKTEAKIENSNFLKDDFSFNHHIKLENIGFRYEGAAEQTLKNINLTIQKGDSVAFIGSSGAGKTTVVDIILGLLEPTEGRVLIDGRDIRKNTAQWQRKIGYIPQPVYLSDDSIRRNVAFGLEDDQINDQQIRTALKVAQLEEFVNNLPNKLETNIGEHGVCLSGGQRQRIGIARALYHDPEILILDEATAALDNETEKEVTKAIEALSRSRTIIAIAHRLTTVRNFDCLFFMKNGRVTDFADFDGLMERNSDFQRMAKPVTTGEASATF